MASKNFLVPLVASAITSDSLRNLRRGWFEIKRRMISSLNTVVFYHRVNDPYSYLLLQAIPRFLEDFKVKLEIQFVLDLPENLNPEQEKWRKYAMADAQRLAQFHDLSFPEEPVYPSDKDALKATAVLLKHKNRPKILHLAQEVTGALWGVSTTTFESCVKRYGMVAEKDARKTLTQSRDQLVAKGHYMSGMLYYGGEWYWGLDRLGHLADRLNKPGIRRDTGDVADYQRQYRHVLQSYTTLRPRPKQVYPLDFYFSFRSPYSYIVAERVFKLAEMYKFPVNIKPVMPMVTRGVPAPAVKRSYIVKDTKREANKYNIPFGKVCDPLGEGVERCMALFQYAKEQGKEKEFILASTTAIWSEGVNVASDSGSKKILAAAGLDWEGAQPWLKQAGWKALVETNRKELEGLGLWGVPSFKYGDLIIWGQDRLWALEEAILSQK